MSEEINPDVVTEETPAVAPAPPAEPVGKPVCPICKGSGKVTFQSSPLCTGVRACSCTEE